MTYYKGRRDRFKLAYGLLMGVLSQELIRSRSHIASLFNFLLENSLVVCFQSIAGVGKGVLPSTSRTEAKRSGWVGIRSAISSGYVNCFV